MTLSCISWGCKSERAGVAVRDGLTESKRLGTALLIFGEGQAPCLFDDLTRQSTENKASSPTRSVQLLIKLLLVKEGEKLPCEFLRLFFGEPMPGVLDLVLTHVPSNLSHAVDEFVPNAALLADEYEHRHL